jgi:DNA-directed RNA polymerase subunit beta
VPEPGVPESFKVLIKELQSLALDVKVLSEDNGEITIRESIDEDVAPLEVNIEGKEDEPAGGRERLLMDFDDFDEFDELHDDADADEEGEGDDDLLESFDDFDEDNGDKE